MRTIISPAKVNLGLWITGKRPDGYHEIYTVFHTVEFHDRIFIKPSYKLQVKTSSPFVPENEENIVYKALKKFEEWTGIEPKFEIFIEKNIPVGAGLGGGSSNAAVVLKEINLITGKPLSEDDLFKLASTVGADVPFFLKGGMAVAEGIGDRLKFFDETLNKEIFIIYPGISVSTGEIYAKVQPDILTKKDDLHIIDSLLGDFNELLNYLENTLGEIAMESYPQIREVYNTLEFLGYRPLVSGSGSSVFAFGKPKAELEKICHVKGWKLIKTVLR
ncbi:4-(cytidine 5'-diphospho)-2-C-methyl-D-erythritol kinase [Persephonella sp.]